MKYLFPASARNFYRTLKNHLFRHSIVKKWEQQGRPAPPPHVVKQEIIGAYQKKYGCQIFIETGTYLGDMLVAMKDRFDLLISVELSPTLWQNAVKRLVAYPHIQLKQGDSGAVLHEIVPALAGPALFWLDGHYSGEGTAKGSKNCPIYEELHAILMKSKAVGHVILIDDARLFTGKNDYPTLDELQAFVLSRKNTYLMETQDDIIRLTPV